MLNNMNKASKIKFGCLICFYENNVYLCGLKNFNLMATKRPTQGAKTLKEQKTKKAAPAPKKATPKKGAKKIPVPKKAAPVTKKVKAKPTPKVKAPSFKVKAPIVKAPVAQAEPVAPVAKKPLGRPNTIPDKQRVTVDLTVPILKCVGEAVNDKEKSTSPYIRRAVIAQLKKDGFVSGKDFIEC